MHINFFVLLVVLAAVFIAGYFVGSNNPAKSVIQKAIDKANQVVK